jgi:YD repeat-containing protein
VDVYFLQDNYGTVEPTEATTFTQFGVMAFDVQYWAGSQWATVPGGAVTGNNKVWRKFTFPAVTTDKIRVVVGAASDGWSRIVEVEAYEGDASQLPAGTGLTGEYYNDYNGGSFSSYALTRADASINFDWAGGSPAPSVNADNFSVRWTGTVVPRYSESYTFYATTDDGVRLWLDGQLVIDRWVDQAPYEAASTPLALEAGRHYAVRMEYYERGGGAMAWLKWSSASQAKEVVPQSRLYGCWKGADQFAKDFFQGALNRQPAAGELQDWAGMLNQAQGDYKLVAESQGLGAQVFTSNEYATRNRADSEYVSDLYRAYLQRAPDAGGLNHWTNEIAGCGADQSCRQTKREDVRRAFDQSLEFTEKVRNLCGTAAASPVNGGAGYNFSTARLDPANRTGGGGVDAYSRNFNFNIPLISLAGRAGLDLGLTLSYNSLVWTEDAKGVTFDADQGFPSPGFRLGFPTVEPKFVNTRLQQAGQQTRYSYLLVTPGGERVELRQAGATNVYESADSSYLRLTEGDGLTLSATDGTRLSFALMNGLFRCTQVMDRNGNYLSVAYYGDGRVLQVTDTLGRVVTFNYDTFQNLISITQPWTREGEPGVSPAPTPDETHKWATFGYADVTLQPSFPDLAVIGDQPGTVIPAVFQVGLADGSFYRFSYNQWGQVWKVTRYAADSVGAGGQPNETHPLSSTRIDLPGSDLSAPSAQSDCPRFKEERTWVEYGIRNQSGEVKSLYGTWAPDLASCEVTLPDGTTRQVSNYHTAAEGWKKGLTASEVVTSGGQTVRTTALTWEHDGVSTALYPTNPRVTLTSVTDPLTQPQPRTLTTKVTYTAPEDFQTQGDFTGTLSLRLPKRVEECDGDCSTPSQVKRTTVTDYKVPNLGQYLARGILGLARFELLYEGGEAESNLRSKVGYVYDDTGHVGDDSQQPKFLQPLPSPAWQHYKDDYGTTLQWRGNVTRVRRYEVDQQNGDESGVLAESLAGYNITGATVFTQDPETHRTNIGYADTFYANVNRTHADPALKLKTYAYPTSVTDPDGFTSNVTYNYDLGVVSELRTPLPDQTSNTPGPRGWRYYDAAGRLAQTLAVENGAYVRWAYPAKMDLVESYTLVEAGKEARFTQVLDGAGRVRATSRYLPPPGDPGTGAYSGNYAGQRFEYDEVGRSVGQSNPAEVTAAWEPAAGESWVYTRRTYDWKGRPLVTTHEADNTTVEYKYGGCGCAGGQIVTVRDEVGRRQRVTYDLLGRVEKTQLLSIQPKGDPLSEGGDADVYSTATNTYDALDNVLQVTEQAGVSGASQVTTMSYDGYGRLSTRHLPAQEENRSTTWTYNDDGTVKAVTDARGAKVTYGYNGRHLVTSVTYNTANVIEGQNVAPTSNVTLGYDAAGNRKQMTDRYGTVTYGYDILSRRPLRRIH